MWVVSWFFLWCFVKREKMSMKREVVVMDAVVLLTKSIARFALPVWIIMSAFAIAANGDELDIADMVGIWLFDKGTGDIAKDSSGNNHDGEIFNAKWVEGKYGRALEFEGNGNSMVKVPHFDELNLEVFTIAAWINVSELGGYQGIIAKDGTDPGGTLRTYGMFVIQGQPGIHYSFRDVAKNHQTINGSAPAADGTWHHVAMTYDGTTMRGYVDGIPDIQSPFTGPPITNTGALTIGSDEPGNYFLKGVVDEVYVIKIALNEEEIAQLMSDQYQAAVEAKGKLASTWGSIRDAEY